MKGKRTKRWKVRVREQKDEKNNNWFKKFELYNFFLPVFINLIELIIFLNHFKNKGTKITTKK